MAFSLPSDPSDGQIASASWGDDVRAALEALANPAACRVYNSANQSITTATRTAITFNSERYDTQTMHSTSSLTDRITIPAGWAGIYQIEGHIVFDANATGYRLADLEVNGTTIIASDSADKRSDNYWIGNPSTQYKLAVGDIVRLVVYQTSGGALNVLASGNYSPELAVRWVGLG